MAAPSIVIAAYNESRVIGAVVAELRAAGYPVVVVDDGSADGTAAAAASAGAIVVRHPINLGQGAALQTGIEFALEQGAETIVTFDADGQHRVADIPALCEALAKTRRNSRSAAGCSAPRSTPRCPGASCSNSPPGSPGFRRGCASPTPITAFAP